MMTRALAQAGKPVVLLGAQALLASAILQGVFKKSDEASLPALQSGARSQGRRASFFMWDMEDMLGYVGICGIWRICWDMCGYVGYVGI